MKKNLKALGKSEREVESVSLLSGRWLASRSGPSRTVMMKLVKQVLKDASLKKMLIK